jgi:hypothetical protein
MRAPSRHDTRLRVRNASLGEDGARIIERLGAWARTSPSGHGNGSLESPVTSTSAGDRHLKSHALGATSYGLVTVQTMG